MLIPAALEREIERLRESAAALTQRLLDAVAKAERAERDGREASAAQAGAVRQAAEEASREAKAAAATAREEEATRFRQEMEAALAEVIFCVCVCVFFFTILYMYIYLCVFACFFGLFCCNLLMSSSVCHFCVFFLRVLFFTACVTVA